jgi:hypothetical protein
VRLGQIDDAAPIDVALPCKGSNWVALFFGQPGGTFADAKTLPTINKPRSVALGKLDADAAMDMAVISDTELAVHFGKGGGEFDPQVSLLADPARAFTDVAILDLDGDGLTDLVVSETKQASVLVFKGKGDREFDAPQLFKAAAAPVSLVIADVDGDGLPDVTTLSATGRSIGFLRNLGAAGLAPAVAYGLGFAPLGHRVVDVDGDGALDLVGFTGTPAVGDPFVRILLGRPVEPPSERFRRGDATADGKVDLNDAIAILAHLFQGGDALACDDGADVDDDGSVSLNDPVLLLGSLFQGAGALPEPGDACGPDPTPDTLGCGSSCTP